MRDDQRPPPHDHADDPEEDSWDEAMDDLFGPDEDEQVTRPRPSRQMPQPAGGNTPPPREYVPDPEHHRTDGNHVLGADNQPPPSSYPTSEREAASTGEQQPAGTGAAIPPTPRVPPGRDWRKIACFGCLALAGIPAMCLAALIALGLIADEDTTDPSPGVFIEESTPIILPASPTPELPGPFATIMDGREPLTVEIDGNTGFGTQEQPIPLGIAAPVGGGWELTVNSVESNAEQAILDANMFNEPSAEDRQYVLANITATRTTEPAEMFEASFRLRVVGGVTGTVYNTFDASSRCGVIPDPAPEDQIISGASITGNVCWQVLQDDADSLMLFNEAFDDRDYAIWFDLTAGSASAST